MTNILTVDYDDDGNRVYYRGGQEISEDEFMTQHPGMKTPTKGKSDGRAGNSGSGDIGVSDSGISAINAAAEVSQQDDGTKEQVRQGLRAERQRRRGSGSPSDGVGQDGDAADGA